MRTRMRITPIAGALLCALMLVVPGFAQRPDRPALAVSGYVIDAELDPATHHLRPKQSSPFPRLKTPKWSASAFIRR